MMNQDRKSLIDNDHLGNNFQTNRMDQNNDDRVIIFSSNTPIEYADENEHVEFSPIDMESGKFNNEKKSKVDLFLNKLSNSAKNFYYNMTDLIELVDVFFNIHFATIVFLVIVGMQSIVNPLMLIYACVEKLSIDNSCLLTLLFGYISWFLFFGYMSGKKICNLTRSFTTKIIGTIIYTVCLIINIAGLALSFNQLIIMMTPVVPENEFDWLNE